MKKIAIITITDGSNYGNRLQNFAMQELLRSLDYQVDTIKRRSSRDNTSLELKRMLIKDSIKKILSKNTTSFKKRERDRLFSEFNKKHIIFSDVILQNNIAPGNLADRYDYFICGSDQIWNARFDFIQEDLQNYLAAFARPEQRIAFAASFGTNYIAPGYENVFYNELPKFKALGIREQSGVDLANKYGNRKDAMKVLDPTLILDKKHWKQIEDKPDYIGKEKFIVTYFLGGRSKVITEYIKKVAKIYDARIVNLDIEFLADDRIENKDHFITTPDEFVWLMHNAECVLTDSFHSTVFSIIFNRPFIVFQRVATEKGNDMSGRIDTLLRTFGLEIYKDDIDNPTKIPSAYKDVQDKIQVEKEKSLRFLKEALGDNCK